MAEWLGRGLQNLPQQFESARDLTKGLQHVILFYIMKHAQTIGILAALAVIGICYMPWVVIDSKQIIVTGLSSGKTSFGKPGLMNIYLSVTALILFIIPRLWSKRINVFIGAINFAWAIRNIILLSTCQAGECPQRQAGIYLLLAATLLVQLMTFFPKIKLPEDN